MKNSEYIVSTIQSGQPFEIKTENPIIAVNYFTGQINYVLTQRIRTFLEKECKNKYTGCDQLELTCHECKLSGEYIKMNCPLSIKEDSADADDN